MTKSVTRQIVDLQNMSSSEMKSLHMSLFPNEPLPYNASTLNLKSKIAYRIQEMAIGGLKDNVKNKLENIANNKTVKRHSNLITGTKLQRAWNGTIYEVEVLKDGFEYRGQKFKSLSAVANKITGTKWNGPKFFNLKQEK